MRGQERQWKELQSGSGFVQNGLKSGDVKPDQSPVPLTQLTASDFVTPEPLTQQLSQVFQTKR